MSPHLSDHGPNVALLKLTLKHIEMAPCTWDQRFWTRRRPECGTTHCFAGWAVALNGKASWYGDDYLDATPDEQVTEDRYYAPTSSVVHVADRARRLLGLDGEQADDLFDQHNTLSDLHRIVDEICAEVTS